MDDDEREPIDWQSDEVKAAQAAVGKAISDYMQAIRPSETPYVVAWVAAIEWTNTELEQTFRAGRDVASPDDQTISASAGLGAYVLNRYT